MIFFDSTVPVIAWHNLHGLYCQHRKIFENIEFLEYKIRIEYGNEKKKKKKMNWLRIKRMKNKNDRIK